MTRLLLLMLCCAPLLARADDLATLRACIELAERAQQRKQLPAARRWLTRARQAAGATTPPALRARMTALSKALGPRPVRKILRLDRYTQALLAERDELTISKDVIACAGGGQERFAIRKGFPVSILYYAPKGATDIRYFETARASADPDDHAAYVQRDLETVNVFHGFLKRLLHPGDRLGWGIVSYVIDDTLHLSMPIRLHLEDAPTEYTPDLLTITGVERFAPRFRWKDPHDSYIYFQAITDGRGSLAAAFYTKTRAFAFFDTTDVVINLMDGVVPKLRPDEKYSYFVMGVSDDNWITFIANKKFKYPGVGDLLVVPGGL